MRRPIRLSMKKRQDYIWKIMELIQYGIMVLSAAMYQLILACREVLRLLLAKILRELNYLKNRKIQVLSVKATFTIPLTAAP